MRGREGEVEGLGGVKPHQKNKSRRVGGGASSSYDSLSNSNLGGIDNGYDNADMVAKRMALVCRDSVASKKTAAAGGGARLGTFTTAIDKR